MKQEEEAKQPLLSPQEDKADKPSDIKVAVGPVRSSLKYLAPPAVSAALHCAHALRSSVRSYSAACRLQRRRSPRRARKRCRQEAASAAARAQHARCARSSRLLCAQCQQEGLSNTEQCWKWHLWRQSYFVANLLHGSILPHNTVLDGSQWPLALRSGLNV